MDMFTTARGEYEWEYLKLEIKYHSFTLQSTSAFYDIGSAMLQAQQSPVIQMAIIGANWKTHAMSHASLTWLSRSIIGNCSNRTSKLVLFVASCL